MKANGVFQVGDQFVGCINGVITQITIVRLYGNSADIEYYELEGPGSIGGSVSKAYSLETIQKWIDKYDLQK